MNTTNNKDTTSISTEKHKPLSVEFRTNYPYVARIGERGIKKIEEHAVAIFAPKTPNYAEMYIIGMTPGTALNLLRWLREHERLLQQLVDD